MMNFLQSAAGAIAEMASEDDDVASYSDWKMGLKGAIWNFDNTDIWFNKSWAFAVGTLEAISNYFEYFGSDDATISRSDLTGYLIDKGFPSDELDIQAHIDKVNFVYPCAKLGIRKFTRPFPPHRLLLSLRPMATSLKSENSLLYTNHKLSTRRIEPSSAQVDITNAPPILAPTRPDSVFKVWMTLFSREEIMEPD
jgi:hypothetical protein